MTETLRADGRSDGAPPTAMAIFVEGLIILLIVLPPLAMGSVAPWARAAVNGVIFAAFAIWFLTVLARGRLEFARTRAWLFIALFLGIVAFQIIPLPPRILAFLSPGAAETYAKVVPGGGEGAHTLSLFPYGTKTVLIRLAALVMLFVLVTHFVRARWQVVGILLALLAIGLFETLYGFGEHFSGRNHVFWSQRTRHLHAVTGTYLNKNHFAGLLEMIVPAGIGLALGLVPRGKGARRLPARVAGVLSSGRWMMSLLCMAAVLILSLGICFSVSRSGIACLVVSFAMMAVFLGISSGFRKYTLVLLILAMAVPLAATAIGSEIVAQRLEPVIEGKSISWIDRVDLARSGISMVAKFPFFGTGAGSFEFAFERFQSIRVGDRIADYLHNDWLQLFCEYGFAGAGIFLVGLSILVGTTLRRALAVRDPFWRWTSLGALCGVGALLLHSFFDYNLSKITANGVIFTMLLGIAFAGARRSSVHNDTASSPNVIRVRLGTVPVRIFLVVVLVILAGLLTIAQVKEAQADIACNRFLSRNPSVGADPYIFLRLTGPASEADSVPCLKRALERAPNYPRYWYYLALYRLHGVEEFILGAARKRAASLIAAGGNEETANAMERLAEALARRPSDFARPELVASLNAAEDAVRCALALQPVSARHNLLMAEIQARKRDVAGTSASARNDAEVYARRALWLGPTRPYVLETSSVILLKQTEASNTRGRLEEVWAETVEFLRRAIASDPQRADRIYAIVLGMFGESEALFSVTPRNLKAYSRLVRTFWEEQRWEEVLACLDEMDEMLAAREDASDAVWASSAAGEVQDPESENAVLGSMAYDRRAPVEIATEIRRRRCLVLGLLGRWEERARAATAYQTLLHWQRADRVAEAQRQYDRRNCEDALRICRQVLRENWSNPDALLIAARAAHALRLPSRAPRWESALDQLYRLAIYNESLSKEVQSEARKLLGRISPETDEERVVKQFVLALLDLRAGNTRAAETGFQGLAGDTSVAVLYWRQRHLIWYYLGRLAETRNAADEAIGFYRRTLDIVPTHRKALMRLAALGEDTASELAALTPDVVCNVNFGGKMTLVGYSIHPLRASDAAGGDRTDSRWRMTYVWEFQDRMFQDCHPIVRFRDREWNVVSHDDRRIRVNNKPYPMDYARNGESVVESLVFDMPPQTVRFVWLGIWSSTAPTIGERLIPDDSGGMTVLELHAPDATGVLREERGDAET